MLVPRIFRRNMFDDFFDGAFAGGNAGGLMKTDIKENENTYELTMDVPGVKKEDIKAELKDGYLTVSATTDYSNDEKDKEGRYVRRERHYGSCSRSFYVGEAVRQEDIKASFENGTLKLTVPKMENKPVIEQNKYIQIEG